MTQIRTTYIRAGQATRNRRRTRHKARRFTRRQMATMWAIAKYAALTVAGIVLFRIGTVYAYRQRGYTAVGGEVFALFLPAIYYAVSRTIKDFIADVINGYTPEFKEDEEE